MQNLTYKDLTLETWLPLFLRRSPILSDHSRQHFPTREILDEFLGQIDKYSENLILYMCSILLLPNCSFGFLDEIQYNIQSNFKHTKKSERFMGLHPYMSKLKYKYTEGLEEFDTFEGCHWVIPLIPIDVEAALSVLRNFFFVNCQIMPDYCLIAHSDATTIIRAKYLGIPKTTEEYLNVMHSLSPREFEHLIEVYYSSMGYRTLLTKASKDGGKDIVAEREINFQRELVVIECKRYINTVGNEVADRIYSVAHRMKATRAIIVTTSKLSREALKIIESQPFMGYLDGQRLVTELCRVLGNKWPLSIDEILQASKMRQLSKTA